MTTSIRVSIVLATFNGEKYIKAQLLSLLDALGEDDEIVVSDDGSSDNTRNIVLSVNDTRIHLLPPSLQLGYQKNFSRAILASRGQYVLFSDQDDICLPERVAKSLQALKLHGCVFGDAIVTDEALLPTSDSYFDYRCAKSFTVLSLFLKPPAIGATMACSREFLNSALPFPDGVPHDHWLSVLAAVRGELQVVRSPFILYRRHLGVASLTGLSKKRSFAMIARERARLFFTLVFWYSKNRFGIWRSSGYFS
jgi:glycosyltransferase involved in cell wall biosynthesis